MYAVLATCGNKRARADLLHKQICTGFFCSFSFFSFLSRFLLLSQSPKHIFKEYIEPFKRIQRKMLLRRMDVIQGRSYRDRI